MTGKIRHIVVIESLGDETKTGMALYQDIISRKIDFKNLDFSHRFYEISSREELQELLNFYAGESDRYQDGLVIHLEMHGADNQSGLVLGNGELLKWTDIVPFLAPINLGSKNGLYITMATCFGRFMYKGVDPHKKSPYAAFISASEAVSVEQVEVDFSNLYDLLLDNGNLIDSYLLMEKNGTKFYYKDSKTCFEDAFKSTMDKLHGDLKLKEKIVADARKEVMEKTGTNLSEEDADMIFQKALRDIFDKHYDAFKF